MTQTFRITCQRTGSLLHESKSKTQKNDGNIQLRMLPTPPSRNWEVKVVLGWSPACHPGGGKIPKSASPKSSVRHPWLSSHLVGFQRLLPLFPLSASERGDLFPKSLEATRGVQTSRGSSGGMAEFPLNLLSTRSEKTCRYFCETAKLNKKQVESRTNGKKRTYQGPIPCKNKKNISAIQNIQKPEAKVACLNLFFPKIS